jgi:ureidoacrylate peracid hydrolase
MKKSWMGFALAGLLLWAAMGWQAPAQTSEDPPVAEKAVAGGWKRPERLFALNSQKAALVIIDMQNFSCVPEAGHSLPRIREVMVRINRLADFCRGKGVPVIWVRQNITSKGGHDDAGLFPLFHDASHTKSMLNRGTGTEIYTGMHFDPACDHVVFKNRYSAFLSHPPELKNRLDSLKRTQLIVVGVAANVCVESTVRDAMQLDYQVVLVSDGVTTTDEALLESTLANTRLFFGDVMTAEEVMEALGKHASWQNAPKGSCPPRWVPLPVSGRKVTPMGGGAGDSRNWRER